ncbi:sensor histidine kinase [Halobacillus litoralis]|nr:sensor histidine kinase [Halobacillus litoralis]
MLLAFVGFVLLPIALIGGISYSISSTTLQSNISEQTVQTLKAVDRNMQKSISEVNTFSDFVISSNEIQSFLEDEDSESIIEVYNEQQSMAGLMYGNAQVDDFTVYAQEGQVVHLKESSIPSFSRFVTSPFHRGLIEQKGRPVWLSPLDNQGWADEGEFLLTQGRVIKDIDTLENLGYLIINIKMQLFDELFSTEEFIATPEGEILYAKDYEQIGDNLDITSLNSNQPGYFLTESGGYQSLVTYVPSSFQTFRHDSLMLVSIQRWDVLASEVFLIRNTTIALLAVAILLALLFNIFYLRRISQFIQESLIRMKQVEGGSLDVEMGAFQLRELRNISKGFNKMIGRIRHLIEDVRREQEDKREAQFQVLQEQINPHFLYNTLESINAMAAMNGQKDISRMTINLGKLLRISINGDFEVTVKEELRHVTSYLEIQKIRFDHRFDFQVDIDGSLKQEWILKLVLQPLVENSIKYAFTEEMSGEIKIRGHAHEGRGFIFVEDNGCGVSREVLESLNRKGSEPLGHGLLNVHKRLQLYYGYTFGLMVCAEENQGTIIKMSFPIGRRKPE